MGFPTAAELAVLSLAQQHPLTRGWAACGERLQLLALEHQIDIDLSIDPQLAKARRDRFAPDLGHDLFYNCWELVGTDLRVMVSIRYEDGDPGRPFVDVSATTRTLMDPRDVDAVIDLVVRRFGMFNPRYLRWWSSAPVGAIRGTLPDKRFLAAPIDQLMDLDVPRRVTVRPSRDLDHYGLAVAAYASVDRAHPDHGRQARIERADDLAHLVRDRTLFDVLVDDDWAGYVGVRRGHKLGLSGYTVAELVLSDSARGHRIGRWLPALVSRQLLDQGATTADVLIGTIHHDNVGALQAAKAAGRYDIGGWNIQVLPRGLS